MTFDGWREAANAIAAQAAQAAADVQKPPVRPLTDAVRDVGATISEDVARFVDALYADHGDTLRDAQARAAAQGERHIGTHSELEGLHDTAAGKARFVEGPDYLSWRFTTPLLVRAGFMDPPISFVVISDRRWFFEGSSRAHDDGRPVSFFGVSPDGELFAEIELSPRDPYVQVARGCMAGWLVLCKILAP